MDPAGERNERIQLLKRLDPSSLAGESIDRFEEESERWASVKPLTGRKLALFRQGGFKATHEVRMCWEPIDAFYRIGWRDEEWCIETLIDDDNRGETLIITMSKSGSDEC